MSEMYCTECPFFEFTGDESDSWYGARCKEDGHEELASMYAIGSLHKNCPLKSKGEVKHERN